MSFFWEKDKRFDIELLIHMETRGQIAIQKIVGSVSRSHGIVRIGGSPGSPITTIPNATLEEAKQLAELSAHMERSWDVHTN